MSQIENSVHATAYPLSDAPGSRPVTVVSNMQAGPLKNRHPMNIGCWNVRTLLDVGSQTITMKNLYDYRVDVTCLSETRLPGFGTRKIKIPGAETSYWLHHSGPNDSSGLHGVAFALSHRAQNALLSWEPISSRIATARFKGSPLNYTIIAIYAPTSSSDATIRDEFYEQLQEVVDRTPRRDLLVIAGDWNARTGSSDDATRNVLGRFGLGQRCDNGNRLLSFAGFNRLVVSNTRFQHPKRHLLTWYSNDGRTASQIDYILVSARWASSIEDCRSFRGAETGNKCGSDHTLVRAKFKLHLNAHRKTRPIKRFNVNPLDDPEKRQELSVELNNQIATHESNSSDTPSSVEETWLNLKEAMQRAASAKLDYVSHRCKDWISDRTIQLSKLASQARVANADNFRSLRRQATQSARGDRLQYWSDMATDMEIASNVGNFSQLFRLIRRASGQHQSQQTVLRNTQGQLIIDHAKKLERWTEHFSSLLNRNRSQPVSIPTSTATATYMVDCEVPDQSELAQIIGLLKNKKSPGEDGLQAELFKACLPTVLEPLHALFCSIWNSGVFPTTWGTSILLPIPKKGDKTVCDNYRGISLIDVAAKVFAILLLRRLNTVRDTRIRPNQGGFRPGRGCVDQIFTLRRILEHRYRFQQPTTACFIDFRAAFDSIHRDSLWSILEADGVPDKLLTLIKAYYSSTKARVRVYGEETTAFALESGVRQGCPLSPLLFNFAIDWTMHNALQGYSGVQLSPTAWITDLDYADDVIVLSNDIQELQVVLDRISHYASFVGLEINYDKTQFFTTNTSVQNTSLFVNGVEIKEVERFKYLGSIILPTGQAKDEIIVRIDNARKGFLQLNKALWKRSEISLNTKIRVYRATIRPILTYACETWPLRVNDLRKLEVFDHWCLRRILKVRWTDRLTNASIRQRCHNIPRLSDFIQQRRLQWFGHVLRKPDNELTKLALSPTPCPGWRCRLGGQLKTWISTVKTDVERLRLQVVYGIRQWNRNWLRICAELAADRRSWVAAIRDIAEADSSSRRSQSP